MSFCLFLWLISDLQSICVSSSNVGSWGRALPDSEPDELVVPELLPVSVPKFRLAEQQIGCVVQMLVKPVSEPDELIVPELLPAAVSNFRLAQP